MAGNPCPRDERPKRGFFVSVGSLVSARAFLALSQILVLPIVARHISIEAFAVMALAMSVVVFCSVLSDAGLGRSLIRSSGYDLDEWSSVFWLLVAVGITLAMLTIGLSVPWARFFNEPNLVPVLATLAIVPLCQSISAAPNAEIERRENYTGIAKVQMITTVVSLGLAVVLALLGAGVWALVAQQVALAVVRLMGIFALTEFRPRLVFSPALIRPHIKFARDALLVSAISVLGGQGAVVAVGKLLGSIPLGIFSMSQRFSRLPQFGLAGPMSTVVYVRMAKAQDSGPALVSIYLASVRLLGFAILPAMALIAAAGSAIFTVFLSEEWARVAPIFALSIGGLAIEAVALVCLTSLFRAVGRTELSVRLSLESGLLLVGLVGIGAFISLEGVAAAQALWGLIIVPRGWTLARRIVPLGLTDCLHAIAPSCIAAVTIAVAHFTLMRMLMFTHVPEIIMGITIWTLVCGLTYLICNHSIKDAVEVFKST